MLERLKMSRLAMHRAVPARGALLACTILLAGCSLTGGGGGGAKVGKRNGATGVRGSSFPRTEPLAEAEAKKIETEVRDGAAAFQAKAEKRQAEGRRNEALRLRRAAKQQHTVKQQSATHKPAKHTETTKTTTAKHKPATGNSKGSAAEEAARKQFKKEEEAETAEAKRLEREELAKR